MAALLLLVGACEPDGDGGDGDGDGDSIVEPDAEPDPDAAPDEGSDATAPSGLADIPELVREVGPQTVAIEIMAEQRGQTVRGAGSGVIWSSDGVIVTNNHVVGAADDVVVVLADGGRYDAEVIAGDTRTDIAIVQIDATGIPAATFTDELPDIGELALALGNPLGFRNTATAGIVSGVDRSLPVVPNQPPLVGLIQTDAAISSGNSGGALVGATGEIIGINVAAVEGAQVPGVAQGLGFAIPSTTVVPVVEQLLENGEVAHAFLGIAGVTVTPQLAERFGVATERGVLVGEVQPGGPADEAGLQQGDVITEFDGRDVVSLGDLLGALRRLEPGETVSLAFTRGGEEQRIEATLGALPDEDPFEPGAP